jgi:hypothetical protein
MDIYVLEASQRPERKYTSSFQGYLVESKAILA